MRTRVTPFAATLPLTVRRPAADTTPSRTSTAKPTSAGHAPRDVAICTLQLPSKAARAARAPVGESAAAARIVATARAELRANISLSFACENRDLAGPPEQIVSRSRAEVQKLLEFLGPVGMEEKPHANAPAPAASQSPGRSRTGEGAEAAKCKPRLFAARPNVERRAPI